MWSLREVNSLDLPKVIRGGVWIQSQIHPTPDLHPSSPCYPITASVCPSLENGGIDLEWPLMLQLHLSKTEKCCHLQCSKFDFCMKSQELFYPNTIQRWQLATYQRRMCAYRDQVPVSVVRHKTKHSSCHFITHITHTIFPSKDCKFKQQLLEVTSSQPGVNQSSILQ